MEMNFSRQAVRLFLSMSMEEAKSVLGLPPGKTPSPQEIQKAYRAKAIQNHPDRGGDPRKMVEVNVAKEILEGKRYNDRTEVSSPSNGPKVDPEAARKRDKLIRDLRDAGEFRDRTMAAFTRTMSALESTIIGYNEPLGTFLKENYAQALDSIHDEIMDGTAEGRDQAIWKKALTLSHGLSSYGFRLSAKYENLSRFVISFKHNDPEVHDVKKLFENTLKFAAEFHKFRELSGQLSALINTEETLPIYWDNLISRSHQGVISYDEKFQSLKPALLETFLNVAHANIDDLDTLVSVQYGIDALKHLSWEEWQLPYTLDRAIGLLNQVDR